MRKTAEELRTIVRDWKASKVLVLGDAMIDEYIVGNATRISPEAPVPIVHVKEYKTHLGGACNVAKNIKALGGEPILVSFTGNDAYAVTLKQLLDEEGIDSYLYALPDIPTTVKTRVITDNQQVVRVDREEIANVPLDIMNELVERLRKLASDVDVIVYSDYAKGFFTSFTVPQLQAVWKGLQHTPKILVDPKVSNIELFTEVYLITPNSKETEESTGVSIADTDGLYKAAGILFDKCHCSHVLTTLGEKGMALFTSRTAMQYVPGMRQAVFDVTGAGDAVIATIAFALANGTPIEDAIWLANCAGAYSVCHIGVIAITQHDLLEMIYQLPHTE